jgi:hypothetical protein
MTWKNSYLYYKFYEDQYLFKLKLLYCDLRRIIFNIFDPPPKRKKCEKFSDYVTRIEKRHALRELHRSMMLTRVFKLNAVNAKLTTKLTKRSRKMFNIMKEQTEHYRLCQYLKKQIENS